VTWRACGRPDGRRTERRVPPGCLVSRHPGEQAGTRFWPSEARSIVARLRRPLLRILDAVAPPYIPWPNGPPRFGAGGRDLVTRTGADSHFGAAAADTARALHFGAAAAGTARARNISQSHQHHQQRIPGQLTLIRTIGPLPDACRTPTGRSGTGVSRR